ncbi:segregation/condensation protein A [Streptomyces pimonensis]|uniref:Segregation and condensation protein A n=1 Tax=Streptomyces pimonensis TaxID=2860288 RepID=A0ABV4J507_9ACTN
MTSNDAPAPGARPPRRRTLGRGAGATPDAPAAGRGAPEEGAGTATPPPPEVTSRDRAPAPQPDPAGAAPPAWPAGADEPDPRAPGRFSPVEPVGAPQLGTAVPGESSPGASARAEGVGTVSSASGPAADVTEDTAGAEPGGGVPRAGAGEDDDGRFTVRLANFEGPFDLLLQLISKHKLDVTEVALSEVTDEFMAYIRAMGPDWDLDETTEFLVVAATLLDLKAARLLPAAEVEDEADLALLEARDLLFARLLQYRAYKRIAEIFSRRLDDEGRRHPRTVGLEPHHAELLPEVVISIGPEGFAGLAVKAMQPRPKPQVYVDHIHAPLVSVQEQAGIVVARLRELGEADFRALVEDTDDPLTVVARFLALLELYREKAVALDQETALGELTVRWTGGDGNAVPTVTDEFDRPPQRPEEERKP